MTKTTSNRKITRQQAQDTGMAMVLICLLLLLTASRPALVVTAILLLVITMTAPQLFTPLARIWLGLSRLAGTFMSRLLLTVVFFGVVTPVASVRKLLGADSLRLRQWRRSTASVFIHRDQAFAAADLERPY